VPLSRIELLLHRKTSLAYREEMPFPLLQFIIFIEFKMMKTFEMREYLRAKGMSLTFFATSFDWFG
jgi:hypothetical protein